MVDNQHTQAAFSQIDHAAVKSAANTLLARAGERSRLTSLHAHRGTGFVFFTSTYTLAVVVVGLGADGLPVIKSILKVIDRTRDYSWTDSGLPGPHTKKMLMAGNSPVDVTGVEVAAINAALEIVDSAVSNANIKKKEAE